jgi:anti-sigma B factor antagonist
MLKVHTKRLDAVEVLSLEGQIVTGETDVLRGVTELTTDLRDIILDLSNVTTVDAHGLGVLLQLREQTLAKGIHLELRNLNQPLREIFEITRLNTVFDINTGVELVREYAYPRLVPIAA